ncbi:MAG TPA: hypothetical protein DD435_09535 [Cyanobacteria bacterium UBA8530]|nr:hypothetical protein [Cyanobacteria bacterium UBA8530]
MKRLLGVALLLLALPAEAAPIPLSLNPWRAEAVFQLGAPALTQWSGEIRSMSLRYSAPLNELVRFQMEGVFEDDLREPVYSRESLRVLKERLDWRSRGGGPPPGLFGRTGEIFLSVEDPAKTGFLKMGQFYRPFGYTEFASLAPPSAIAPLSTPLSDQIGLYQPSVGTYARDIGAMLVGRASGYGYTVALLNGSGADRPDGNAQKDVLLRVDLMPNENAEIGLSFEHGANDAVLEGVPFVRRDFGLHAKVETESYTFKGEYVLAQRLGLDERKGWYLDLQEKAGTFLQFGENRDQTFGYRLTQLTVGIKRPLMDGLWSGAEYDAFWEAIPGRSLQFNRYIATLGVAL